jgi:hypothetical protein
VVESNTFSQLSKAIKDYTRRWQNTFCQTHFNVLGKRAGQANDIEMQYDQRRWSHWVQSGGMLRFGSDGATGKATRICTLQKPGL